MPDELLTRRRFLRQTTAAGVLIASAFERGTAQPQVTENMDERQRIERAIPAEAPARPLRPRKLLIFDLNVGYGGHGSIRTANQAFTQMGQRTGAFETVVSRDPAVFEPASLWRFDTVFFNNTVGNLFEDLALRESLVEFVYAGGGLMGVHGTSVAFTKWPGAIEDWPEFGIMLGARGANHKANDEHVVIKLDDPTHPVNQVFGGQDFDYRDEFFRVHEPYSRDRVRVLMSIDTARTDMQQEPSYGAVVRADNDYALAWVRQYGRGRVFYCTIAHHPSVFWDPKMLQFYLAATQFALGDLPAPTTPSAKLTPAIRAQEELGWRLNLVAAEPGDSTFFDTIDRASELGMLYVGGSNRQKISRDIPKKFHDRLAAEEMQQIRLKLDAASVRLLTYHVDAMPSDSAGQLKIVEFAQKMGIEAVVAPGTRIAPEGKLPQIVSLDKAARAQGIDSLLDETRRQEQGPVIFCVESGDDELKRTIETFNKAVTKPT
ncbi:ThuA domain-containing protein [Anaerobaca lacustris]|uniref:ThuA domain-containing protein n=1 Tax=Anaerobaca lacustris TaxID=3044600 RepID=A0AAW6TVW9_9BACT|nr:ThuA domain-containing protein [Sedimentisphaerales bacterium M17dextr]